MGFQQVDRQMILTRETLIIKGVEVCELYGEFQEQWIQKIAFMV